MTIVGKENVPLAETDNGQAKGRRLCRAYKTQICTSFILSNECKYGDMCCFAHGLEELRQRPNPPKYKTAVCRNMVQFGHCPYGDKCDFIHSYQDDKPCAKVCVNQAPAQQLLVEAKPERIAYPLKYSNSLLTIHDLSGFKYAVPPNRKLIESSKPNSTYACGNTGASIGSLCQISSSGFGLKPITPNYVYPTTSNSFTLMLDQGRTVTSSTRSNRDAYSFDARESGFYGILATMDRAIL